MNNSDEESAEFDELVRVQKEMLELQRSGGSKKKDMWDRFSTLSTFLSTVVIAALGLYFTHVYNERQSTRDHQTQTYQTRILEMQTVEKFIPHLTGDEETKKVALLALTSLGSPEFATRFAKLNPSEGTESAADVIMATATAAAQTQVPVATSTSSEGLAKEGWAYLGHYLRDRKTWKTKYFSFDDKTHPDDLRDEKLEVRERTGALNVRIGMPTPDGRFPNVVDVLKPGSTVVVVDVQEWHSTGYMWAKIKYGT